MKATLGTKNQKFLLLLTFLIFTSCKQSEFYDKAAVLGMPNQNGTEGSLNPSTETPNDSTSPVSNSGNTSNGNTGSNEPTVPIIVTTPPTTLPPVVVITPPSIPVDQNSGTNPPIIVSTPTSEENTSTTPPSGTTTQPPKSDVIVVTPPVVTPPIINEPSVLLTEKSEVFTQDKHRDGDVDILWVIDDSGSMADNQQALAQNFSTFIDDFINKKVNFKMAITTTDGTSGRNGKMIGNADLLTSAEAIKNAKVFTNHFKKWIQVGTHGSGKEQGLKCASSFMDRYSSSFLRSDAYLAIVFVSDEEDQSEKKKEEYLEKLKSLKAHEGMVKAYSIVTQQSDKNAKWETVGARYNYVAEQTNGLKEDIRNDFSKTLDKIGFTIANLVDTFALSASPYQNKIEVYVNNSKVTSGWSFDTVSRTLKFEKNSIPATGAQIEIKYQVKANVLGAI